MQIIRRGFLAAVIACSTAFGCAAPLASPKDGVPALKVTAPSGRTSILIGSIHVGVERLRQPDSSVFSNVKRYVIEQVAGEGPQVPQPVPGPDALAHKFASGKWARARWATELGDREIAGLKERLLCNGYPQPSTVEDAAAMLLALERPLTAEAVSIRRCSPGNLPSRDAILARYAADRKILVSSLELNSEVEPRRRAVEDRIYVHSIRVAMTDRQDQAMRSVAKAIDAGDYESVILILRQLSANEEDFASFRRLMIDDRNEAWMPRLLGYLDEGDAFVNVGAAHIAGKKGLISLLKARGYKVETVLLPVASP